MSRDTLVGLRSVLPTVHGDKSGSVSSWYELVHTRAAFEAYLLGDCKLIVYDIPSLDSSFPSGCGVTLQSLLLTHMRMFPDFAWDRVSECVCNLPNDSLHGVLQGDGSQQGQMAIVQFSIYFLNHGRDCISPLLHFPLVLFFGPESYENIQHNFRRLKVEIESMASNFVITHPITGKQFHFDIRFSSDLKMICTFCGLPHGKVCPFCKVLTSQLASAQSAAVAQPRCVGETHLPILSEAILPLDIQHIIEDVLHCEHRCSDKMFDLLAEAASVLNSLAKFKPVRQFFIDLVRETAAPHFDICKSQTSGAFEFRNIDSDQKLHFAQNVTLEQIQKLFSFDSQDNSNIQTDEIFNAFSALSQGLKIAHTWLPSSAQIAEFKVLVAKFNESFLEQWGGADFCVYMHIFIFHLYAILAEYGNAMCFSCFANEKVNDINKHIFFAATNHRNNTAGKDDVLKAVLFHRLRMLLNPFSPSIPHFICPQCNLPCVSLSGLIRHIQRSPHNDREELIKQVRAKCEEATEEGKEQKE